MRIIKRLRKRAKKYKKGVKSFRWHHPFVIPVATFMVLFFVGVGTFIGLSGETIGASDTRVVKLTVDGKEMTVPTRAHTVGDLLEKLDIKLSKNDAVDPSPKTPIAGEDFRIHVQYAKPYLIIDEGGKRKYAVVAGINLKDAAVKAGFDMYYEDIVAAVPTTTEDTTKDGFVGTKMIINRATPVVVNLYGKSLNLRSHAKTVGDVLEDKGIVLRKGDSVHPKTDKKITSNLGIFVLSKGQKIVSVEEAIDPPIEHREDPRAPVGSETVLEEGSPGLRVVTYRIKSKDGKEIGRTQIQSVVVTQPTKRVIIIGTQFDGFDGSLSAAMAALRNCEAGGNYSNKSNPLYRGAYQFHPGTWNNFGGYADPADAPPFVQDQKALETYRASGWSPWPSCSSNLGLQDVYR
jgi:uncharacterized protein YabE (DUF348 family)